MLPDVSIVVAARSAQQLLGCIDALTSACPEDATFDLVIAPLGDDDSLRDTLRLLEGDVRVLEPSDDPGAGWLAGARAAGGEWVLFVDETDRPDGPQIRRLLELTLLPALVPAHDDGKRLLVQREHLLALGDVISAAVGIESLAALTRFARPPIETRSATEPRELRLDPAAPWEPGLVSIVIPVWNQLDMTRRCIDSVLQHSRQPFEVIVVDNGSEDGTGEWLARQPRVRTLSNDDNRGFAVACNQGIAAARGEFVVLLNNDTVVNRFWLEGLLAPFASPEVGATGPRSNSVSGSQLVPDCDYTSLSEMRRVADEWRRAHRGEVRDTTRLVGFCLAVRRSALVQVGGLDEAYGQGNFEDDDLCRRLTVAGWRLQVADGVFVHHEGSATFRASGTWHSAFGVGLAHYRSKWNGLAPRVSDEPLLSACLIVKDEQRFLPRCLASLADLVDEVIVCDTGSRDRTVEIAQAMGATVTHFEWCDDFAAARNAAVDAATGRWVLQIDADEEAVCADPAAFRRSLAQTEVTGIATVISSFNGLDRDERTTYDHEATRVFRRDAARYVGRVHELAANLDGSKLVPWRTEALKFWHHGYTAEMYAERSKPERNLRIAGKRLEDSPGDAMASFEYARSLHLAGQHADAVEVFGQLLRRRDLAPSRRAFAARVVAVHALSAGRLEEALEWSTEAVRLEPGDSEAQLVHARVLHALGRIDEALAALADRDRTGVTHDRLTAGVTVPVYRWLLLLLSGRAQEARRISDEIMLTEHGHLAFQSLGRLADATTRPALTAAARRLEQERPAAALALWQGLGSEPEHLLGAARCLVGLDRADLAVETVSALAEVELSTEDTLFVAALALTAGRVETVGQLLTRLPVPCPREGEARELARAAGGEVHALVDAHLAS